MVIKERERERLLIKGISTKKNQPSIFNKRWEIHVFSLKEVYEIQAFQIISTKNLKPFINELKISCKLKFLKCVPCLYLTLRSQEYDRIKNTYYLDITFNIGFDYFWLIGVLNRNWVNRGDT